MASLTLNNRPFERISYPGNAPESVRFAAAELRRYLNISLGVNLRTEQGTPARGTIFITVKGKESPWVIKTGGFQKGRYDRSIIGDCNGCLLIAGENPISALYAVYDFLQQQLGLRFYGPGGAHEHIPARTKLNLEKGFILKTGSAFSVRDYFFQGDITALDFAVKNRINTILPTTYPNKPFSQKLIKKCLPEIKKRGVKIEGPGHSWSMFIPPKNQFVSHPEYFPLIDGKRQFNGLTACFSNPKVRKIFTEKVRHYLKKHSYWDVVAFYPEDINLPFYCGCPECAKKKITYWYLSLINQIAEIAEKEIPGALVEFIAYHGTRVPPHETVKLHRNGKKMRFLSCHYSRDMYHPFSNKTFGSAVDFQMYRSWRKYLKSINYQGEIVIAEYYNTCEYPNQGPRSRALLWPLEVMRKDAQFYFREGLNGLMFLTCFDHLCWPSPFPVWGWLQLYQNPETTVESLKNDFYPSYFGAAGLKIRRYMNNLESAMHNKRMPESLDQLAGLKKMLQACLGFSKDNPLLRNRLQLLKIHYEYCVLLKKIWQAFLNNDMSAQKKMEKPFREFFEEKYRQELSGEIDIPFPWANTWYEYFSVKPDGISNLVKERMLH